MRAVSIIQTSLLKETLPTLHRLFSNPKHCIDLIEKNLNEVAVPLLHNLKKAFFDFTPKEVQIADLIKEGKTT